MTAIPPPTPALTWGPLQAKNRLALASAWQDLEAAVARVDGSETPGSADQYIARLENESHWEANSIGAFTSQGQLVVCGWAAPKKHLKNEYRIFLDGLVHPDFRGLGLGGACYWIGC